jgi:acyl carrier protein
MERKVAALWQEVLGAPQVGVNDNFFDLGGHSLNLIQIQIKLKELFDCEMTVVDMFRYPTINALAKFLSNASGELQGRDHNGQRAVHQRMAATMQARRARSRRQVS